MTPQEIEISGIVLLEPLSSLTDFITGIVSLFLAYLLSKSKSPKKSMTYFKKYFFFLGLATVCAGTFGHALLYYLSFEWKMIGWSFSAIGLYFFERASIQFFKSKIKPKLFNTLNIVATIQLIVFFTLLAIPATRSFKVVQLNATFCYIIIILPLYLYSIFSWKIYVSRLVIAAIAYASLLAIVYNNKIGINAWFDHHVITHLLMTSYVIFMYYAVTKLRETSFNK